VVYIFIQPGLNICQTTCFYTILKGASVRHRLFSPCFLIR